MGKFWRVARIEHCHFGPAQRLSATDCRVLPQLAESIGDGLGEWQKSRSAEYLDR